MRLILTYLKEDIGLFTFFKPNKPLLRKMDLNGRIMSIDNQESEITLEFCSFIMRHHRAIDYSDFTDSPFAI